MVTASATFEIDPGTGSFNPPGAYAVASGGATVICRIADVTGIKSATWRIYGTHSSAVSAPAITLGGTPYGQTATFTLPAGTGQAYGIEVVAIRTDNHQLEPVTSKVLVDWAHGNVNLRPVFNNETTQQDATHGWVMQFNYLLEHAFDGATGPAGPPGGETFPWTYATSTVDADPGNGLLRMDGASFAATDTLFVDLINANGVDMTDWLDSIEGGTITLFRGDARSTNFAIYRIEAVATATGYRKIHLRERIVSVGSLDTTAANTYVSLDRSGGGGGGGDIFEVSVTATLGTAAANTVTYEAVTVPGVLAGDVVIAVDTDDLGTPTSVLQAIVTDDEEITLPLCNPSSGGDAVGELDLKFLIYRPGNSLRQYTATVDFGTVPTIETSYVAASVPGVRAGDFVVATVHDIDAPSGTGMCRVTGANAVEIPIVNPSGSGDVIGSKSVTFTVVRLGVPGFLLKSAALTLAEVPADTAPHFSHTVTGALDGDYVCNVTADLSATALTLSDARVSADDTIEFSAANPTAGGITPGATDVTVLLWRPANAAGLGPAGGDGNDGNDGDTGPTGPAGRPGGDTFIYTFKADTDDDDPFTPYAKVNAPYVRDATMLFLDEDSFDVPTLNEWIESFPEGGTIHLYERDDPATFAIFELGAVTASTNSLTINYYRVELRSLIAGKEGDWTFDTTDGNLIVSLIRGGTGGSIINTSSDAGVACLLNPWRRVHHADFDGRTNQVVFFVPRLNQWLLLSFTGDQFLADDEGAGASYGDLFLFAASSEGGSVGLTEFNRRNPDATEGWRREDLVDNAGTAKGPICAAVGRTPATGTAETTRIFVGMSRLDGMGTASNKLAYSDDFGKTFTFVTLNRSDDVGPKNLIFTGLNWIACYDAASVPYFEYSTNNGLTWTNAAKGTTDARRFLATNGSGLVVSCGLTESVDVSTDHGVSWTEYEFPARDVGEQITGLVWMPAQEVFYALTTANRFSTSDDGSVWEDWAQVEFELERYNGEMLPLNDTGLVVVGSVLAAPMFYSEAQYGALFSSDVFYSLDGRLWKHSGAFARQIVNNPALAQRPRVQLRSSTPTVVTGADRAQLFLIPPLGSPGTGTTGGQFSAGYVSAADRLVALGPGASLSESGVSSTGTLDHTLLFKFDDGVSVSNPGDGYFRFGHEDPELATQVVFNDANVDNIDVSFVLKYPGEKRITISNATGSVRHVYTAWRTTALTDYTLFDLDHFEGTGSFTPEETYSVDVDVTASAFATRRETVRLYFSSSTSVANPGSRHFLLDNMDPASATAFAVSATNTDGQNIGLLENKPGSLILNVYSADLTTRHQYQITSKTDNTSWTQWDVTWVAGTGGFTAEQEYAFELDAWSTTSTTAGTLTPEDVAAAGATGAATAYSREDHVHAHGAQTDPTMHALASGSGAGFLPTTAGVTAGWVPVVQLDETVEWAAASAATAHGSLSGLGNDDHPHYLLASGSRALASTWSLGGNTLTNVATMSGTTLTLSFGTNIDATAGGTFFQTAPNVNVSASTGFALVTPFVNIDAGASGFDLDSTGLISFQTNGANIALNAAGGTRNITLDATGNIASTATSTIFQTSANMNVSATSALTAVTPHFNFDAGASGFDLDSTGPIDLQTNGANVNISAAGGTRDANVTATGEINLNAPIIDANSNPITRVSYLQINDGDSLTGLPTAGTVELRAYSGPDSSNPGGTLAVASRFYLENFPIAEEAATGLVAGNTLQASIDFSNVRGYNLSGCTIRLRVHLQSTRTGGTETQYSGQDEEAIFYVSTNQSGNMAMSIKEQGHGALGSTQMQYWTADNSSGTQRIFWSETGASTVVITGTIAGSGTRRGIMVVSIAFAQVP